MTPNSTALNRRYLYQLRRGKTPIWFHDREKSMAFDRIEIASSFCRFIRETWTTQAYVVLEPGNSDSEVSSKGRKRSHELAFSCFSSSQVQTSGNCANFAHIAG